MIRTALTSALISLATMVPWLVPAMAATETELLRFSRTCLHFENKARFKSRGPSAGLDAILADSCRAAVTSLRDEVHLSPYVSKRARLYLERLAIFKDRLTAMNIERFRAPRGRFRRPSVTTTGEYLIAHHVGLIALYRDWADETDFKLAGT